MERAASRGRPPLLQMTSEFVRQAKILIVDDELPNVRLLESLLKREGYQNLISTTDSRQVLPIFTEHFPDLVLLDLNMPHLDGYEVLRLVADLVPEHEFLPIIVLTADVRPATKRRALASGAIDFLCKPFDNQEVALRIRNALRTRGWHLQLQDQNLRLEESVNQRTQELEKTLAELRTTQQRVVQQERLHALGMMATGIAHDFNNVLALIMGYSELLLNDNGRADRKEKTSKYLRTVIGAAQDAAQMVNRLAQFHRPPSETDLRQRVRLGQIVEQAIALTMPKWKGQAMARGVDIEMVQQLDNVPDIAGDPAELRELLTNMIFNAVDAMPDGGTVTVKICAHGDCVVLKVADTGTGMTEEVRQRCLEPFFTTKGEGGSGLGLAMIYGIVQRHGGTLDIETQVGVGTKFEIRLPIYEGIQKEDTVPADNFSGPLKILAVDDQPVLCEILTEYLEGDCHKVTTAHTGDQALKRFQENDFDLVITDQAMPGMNGDQLAATIRHLQPTVPIMLLTGFGDTDASSANRSNVDVIVGKPINLPTLRQAIAKLMSRVHVSAAD